MSYWIAYNSQGRILQIISGSEEDCRSALEPGVGLLPTPTPIDTSNMYVAGDGTLRDRPAKQSKSEKWDWGTKSWVDPRSFAQLKAAKWALIKAERSRRMTGTFGHAGDTYDVDPVNIAGASVDAREAIIAGETSWTQLWVLSNNSVISMTAPEMIALGRAAKSHVSSQWATSQYLRGLIDSATSVEQLEAISWPV